MGDQFQLSCQCGRKLKLRSEQLRVLVRCPECRGSVRTVFGGDQPAPGAFRFAFVVLAGPSRVGEQIYLGGSAPLDIGKLPGNAICLLGSLVSRLHCRLIRNGSGWSVEDQGSRNGLFVNQRRVGTHALVNGERVRVGDFELQFRDTGAAGKSAATAMVKPVAPPPAVEDADADVGICRIAEEIPSPPVPTGTAETPKAEPGPVCPGCARQLQTGAKICVQCGINVQTGRSILTADDSGMDETYEAAERVISVVSWIIPAGIYPIASEAFGTRKPHVIRTIALITIAISAWFWAYEWTGSPRMHSLKNLMLWSGGAKPTAEDLAIMCQIGNFGDTAKLDAKYEEMADSMPDNERFLAAHQALAPEDQCIGRYAPAQLLTHAFLHGGILHIAGNLLFLLVLGTRVNALIGGTDTAIVYPLLAIAGGIGHMLSTANDPPHPMIGASGAIMGLAGMYVVLFPAHRVHMAAWWRWGLATGFHLSLSLFTLRGIWVVAFYIAFDVVYTALGVKDGTAHWAHLGGFLVGVTIAVALLIARLVNARGGDIFSVLLGKHAWALVGKPSAERKAILGG